jgi:hypothetical protein
MVNVMAVSSSSNELPFARTRTKRLSFVLFSARSISTDDGICAAAGSNATNDTLTNSHRAKRDTLERNTGDPVDWSTCMGQR